MFNTLNSNSPILMSPVRNEDLFKVEKSADSNNKVNNKTSLTNQRSPKSGKSSTKTVSKFLSKQEKKLSQFNQDKYIIESNRSDNLDGGDGAADPYS